MLSHKKSLNILKKTNALLEGHFVLSSGLHSSKYIQCAKLLSFPHLAKNICMSLAEKIKKNYKSVDLILAPAMGGVIIGYEVGRLLKKETIFCERVDGKFVLRRGFNIKRGSKVLILEDVITGDLISLTSNTDYYFINTFIDFTHRFNILFSSITSINELDYPRHIEVEGVDVLGRKVHKEYKGIRIKINH